MAASLNNHTFTLRYCSHTATKNRRSIPHPHWHKFWASTDGTDWCVIASTQVAALHGGVRHN